MRLLQVVFVILTIRLPPAFSSTSYLTVSPPVSIDPDRSRARREMDNLASYDKDSNAVDPHPSNEKIAQLESIMANLQRKYSHQPVFLQSVQELFLSIQDLLLEGDDLYRKAVALLIEPERTISFRVSWMDDQGVQQANRGWRVEFNRYCTHAHTTLFEENVAVRLSG